MHNFRKMLTDDLENFIEFDMGNQYENAQARKELMARERRNKEIKLHERRGARISKRRARDEFDNDF